MNPESLKIKTTRSFETSETNHPTTHIHIQEDRNPTIYGLFNYAASSFTIRC
jgi:hypothetical protein